jgi:hypothetical protein
MSAPTKPRVWLVAGLGAEHPPAQPVEVVDDQLHHWIPGPDGLLHTVDGRHHASWTELHQRTDLREVSE